MKESGGGYSITTIEEETPTPKTYEYTFSLSGVSSADFNDDYSLNYDLSIKVSDLTLADHIFSTTTDENGVKVTLDNYFDYNFSTLTITLTEKNA